MRKRQNYRKLIKRYMLLFKWGQDLKDIKWKSNKWNSKTALEMLKIFNLNCNFCRIKILYSKYYRYNRKL